MKMARQPAPRPSPTGVYAATITPRREGEVEVDLGAMLEVVDFVTSRGVDGVSLFGSTGEFLHFTPDERSRFIGLAAKRCRVPVLANVSHSTLDGAIAMAEEAAGAGVAGVCAMPPYYFRYDAESIRSFFLELSRQVSKWVPVYLCNIPEFTNPIPVETAEELLRSGGLAGIEDSSGDWAYMERLLAVAAEVPVTVLCGDDRLFARACAAGASGVVSGVAAAVPELVVALDRAVRAGDEERAGQLQAQIETFVERISKFPSPVGIRAAAAARGIKTGGAAVPPGPSAVAELAAFREWFGEWVKEIEK